MYPMGELCFSITTVKDAYLGGQGPSPEHVEKLAGII